MTRVHSYRALHVSSLSDFGRAAVEITRSDNKCNPMSMMWVSSCCFIEQLLQPDITHIEYNDTRFARFDTLAQVQAALGTNVSNIGAGAQTINLYFHLNEPCYITHDICICLDKLVLVRHFSRHSMPAHIYSHSGYVMMQLGTISMERNVLLPALLRRYRESIDFGIESLIKPIIEHARLAGYDYPEFKAIEKSVNGDHNEDED
jgi:hypothetical protein